MKKMTITVTEAARNFVDCINRVHYQNTSYTLLKNGKPLARIIPESEKICTGRDLAKALSRVDTTAEEAKAWHKDLVAARKGLKNPDDKWQ
jgi:antitoxin (DNA-binding transcriptional repressor) of toxin-antitoxin stability system